MAVEEPWRQLAAAVAAVAAAAAAAAGLADSSRPGAAWAH
eukprot:COSAG06_NODE_929_length_11465_cov_4.106722_2_plen_40_part_00